IAPTIFSQDAGIAAWLNGANRLLYRHIHRVKLVVTGEYFRDFAAAIVIEHDERAEHAEESFAVEEAAEHHLQLGERGGRYILPFDRPPGKEPFAACCERADPRLD